MTGQDGISESDQRNVPTWLRWVKLQPMGCYLCKRILFESELHGGQLKVLEVRGVELTRQEQIAHLARCVPERQQGKE